MEPEELMLKVDAEPETSKYPEWPDDEKWNASGPFDTGVIVRIKHMGTKVFTPEGVEIHWIKDVEVMHRPCEVPMIRLTMYPSRVTVEGKAEMVTMCPSCGEKKVFLDDTGAIVGCAKNETTNFSSSGGFGEFVIARERK